MLKIVLEAEVFLVEFNGTPKVLDVDSYMIDALEHTVLLTRRIAPDCDGLQASEKTPARE
jgi:hypothetical protein